jgi:hypothetical protein
VTVWRCAHADCTFVLYPKQQAFLLGRATECWTCGDAFRMSEENLAEDLPLCRKCREPELVNALDELLSDNK